MGGSSPSLAYALLNRLGRSIASGDYDFRPFPNEAEVAKTHGVSRTVTREALKMLFAKGLIVIRPRTGVKVQPLSAWNLFDAEVLHWLQDRKFSMDLLCQYNQVRLAIEPEAAGLAARARGFRELRTIRTALEAMARAEGGAGDLLEADIAFHVAILHAAENPFYDKFQPIIDAALRTSIGAANRLSSKRSIVPEHAAVADAIEQGDATAARQRMRTLIEDVQAAIARSSPARA